MVLDGWPELGEIMFKWYKKWRAGKIQDETLREKTLADIDGEPWVKVVNVHVEDPQKPSSGYMELDWNQPFVKSLIDAGYSGRKDEDVVDMWFTDLCRGVTKEIPE
mgnify:CR=1 FL=1